LYLKMPLIAIGEQCRFYRPDAAEILGKFHETDEGGFMAQRVQVLLVDDIDGGDAAETVSFALDGVSYEIDLSQNNASKFRDDLAAWTGHARRSGGRKLPGRRKAEGKAPREDLSAVRAWGRQNGFTVSDRGRVPADLQAAFDKANG
jgi:Lsr2